MFNISLFVLFVNIPKKMTGLNAISDLISQVLGSKSVTNNLCFLSSKATK